MRHSVLKNNQVHHLPAVHTTPDRLSRENFFDAVARRPVRHHPSVASFAVQGRSFPLIKDLSLLFLPRRKEPIHCRMQFLIERVLREKRISLPLTMLMYITSVEE